MTDIRLLHGDCLEHLKRLDANSIDLTVTSPPYDNLRSYNGNISSWNFAKFQEISRELFRVTAHGGVVVWIVNDATINGSETGSSFRQALAFKDVGFNLHDTMIWRKSTCAFPDTVRYYANFEFMFVFSKGRPRAVNLIQDRQNKFAGTLVHGTERLPDGSTVPASAIKNNTGRRVKEYGVRFNVWDIPEEKSNKTGHPAPYPEKLATDHILTWSNPGDVILDPFTGSGTTGIACIKTGRRFIGMEIDADYYEIAKRRIDEAESQQRMEIDT